MVRKKLNGFGAGLPSILMIFVVLVLTVFAVLGYLSAKADTKLTSKKADYVRQYQGADAKANVILYQLDEKLLDACKGNKNVKDLKDFFDKEKLKFEDTELPCVSYQVEVNENQTLCVTIEINLDSGGEIDDKNRYIIREWRTKSNAFEVN